MAGRKKQPRGKGGGKDPKGKPRKKKVSPLVKEGIDYVDYKDVTLLRAFLSERAKIRARRVSGNDRQQQRAAANAVKIAREMALLPYTNRITTQRGGRGGRGRDGDRREDGPPRPTAPPPRPGEGDAEAPAEDTGAVTEEAAE